MDSVVGDIGRGLGVLVLLALSLTILGFVLWLIGVVLWLGWVFLTRVFPAILCLVFVVVAILFVLWTIGRVARALRR